MPHHFVSNNRAARRAAASTKKPRRVLRLPGVMAKTGWSRSTVYAKIAAGLLPPPAHLLDGKAAVWDENEIDEIVERAFAARDEAAAG